MRPGCFVVHELRAYYAIREIFADALQNSTVAITI